MMEVWGIGRGEWVRHADEDGREWLWALCEVEGCPNNVCARMNDRFCWPHLMSGGAPELHARRDEINNDQNGGLVALNRAHFVKGGTNP